MRNFKSFALGAVSSALAMTLVGSAFAASGKLTIEVNPDISIKVNGATFQPKDANGKSVPVFEYNGTTYAPLRALAEAYGLEVGYDESAKMATVGEQAVTPPSNQTDSPQTAAPEKKLADMSYDEFKSQFKLQSESGEKGTYTNGDGEKMPKLYYYNLEYTGSQSELKDNWNAFIKATQAKSYMTQLCLEYSKKAPENEVSVSLKRPHDTAVTWKNDTLATGRIYPNATDIHAFYLNPIE